MLNKVLISLTILALLFLPLACAEENNSNNDQTVTNGDELTATEDPSANDSEPLSGWSMFSGSEQYIENETVVEKMQVREEAAIADVEEFIASYANQLKEEYPDHSIIVEAYQDGELVAELELE